MRYLVLWTPLQDAHGVPDGGPDVERRGNGLRNRKARAEEMGAAFSCGNTGNGGMLIMVELPLR